MTATAPSSTPADVQWAILRAMARTFGKVYPDTRHGKTVGWMIVCYVEGRRYRIRSVQVQGMEGWAPLSEDLAHHVLESIRAEIRSGTPELAAIAPYLRSHAPQRTFGAAWDRFVEHKIRQGREGRQVSRERLGELQGHRRRGHLAPLLDLPVDRIDYGVLEDWRGWLFAQGLSSGSVHHLVADVGTCLRWLARRREIPRAPDLPTVRIARAAPRIPDPETQERLLAAIPWPLRGIFLARGRHGLRPSEARRARVSDWSWTLEPVTLADGSQVPVHTLSVRGKGGRDRRLPVPEGSELARWVAEHVPAKAFGAEPLFRNPAADPDGDGKLDGQRHPARLARGLPRGVHGLGRDGREPLPREPVHAPRLRDPPGEPGRGALVGGDGPRPCRPADHRPVRGAGGGGACRGDWAAAD